MSSWKTMSEIAEELKISKDLVKYHRKKLDNDDVMTHRGLVYISASGVEKIKQGLRKENYSLGLEGNVIQRISEVEAKCKFLEVQNKELLDMNKDLLAELKGFRREFDKFFALIQESLE